MKRFFQDDFISFLQGQQIPYQWIDESRSIVFLPVPQVYVQCVVLEQNKGRVKEYFKNITFEYQLDSKIIWRIWEDQWLSHTSMIQHRILALHASFRHLFARKLEVHRIDKSTSDAFLTQYHLMGPVGSRYKFGLYFQEELLAVACFSNPRPILVDGLVRRSAELVRFACKSDLRIAGGLGKLIAAYLRSVNIEHLVSYTDIDFNIGSSFSRLGFIHTEDIPPQAFVVDGNFKRHYINHKRVSDDLKADFRDNIFYNGGSRKWILFPILGR